MYENLTKGKLYIITDRIMSTLIIFDESENKTIQIKFLDYTKLF